MATITGASLITRAATLIQDATAVRWPRTELLDWLNDGQREVVLLKPEASVTNAATVLTASTTRQTLPSTGIQLIDITRNMGAGGATPGQAIRLVSREVLDAQVNTWHSDANSGGYIKHYTYDPRDPRVFYVYPKAPASAWYVELVYSSSPTDTTDGGSPSAIGVDDTYANALLDYMLYRAYSKDAEYAQNAQLAVAHYSAFQNSLGVKSQNDMSHNPNLVTGGFNPNVPGAARQ